LAALGGVLAGDGAAAGGQGGRRGAGREQAEQGAAAHTGGGHGVLLEDGAGRCRGTGGAGGRGAGLREPGSAGREGAVCPQRRRQGRMSFSEGVRIQVSRAPMMPMTTRPTYSFSGMNSCQEIQISYTRTSVVAPVNSTAVITTTAVTVAVRRQLNTKGRAPGSTTKRKRSRPVAP